MTIIKEYNKNSYKNYRIIEFEKYKRGVSEKRERNDDRDYKDEAEKRAKRVIRELIRNAFADDLRFITLTYEKATKDRRQVIVDIKDLIRKLRVRRRLEYIYVIEEHKSKNLHAHLIIKSKYIRVKELQKAWGRGFVKINKVKGNINNCINYTIKYIGKAWRSGEHRYCRSRGWGEPKRLLIGFRLKDYEAYIKMGYIDSADWVASEYEFNVMNNDLVINRIKIIDLYKK